MKKKAFNKLRGITLFNIYNRNIELRKLKRKRLGKIWALFVSGKEIKLNKTFTAVKQGPQNELS